MTIEVEITPELINNAKKKLLSRVDIDKPLSGKMVVEEVLKDYIKI